MIILDKDEHIVFQVRRHWFIFATQLAILLCIACIPLLIFIIIGGSPVHIVVTGNMASFITFVYSAWLFVLWVVGFVFWTDYYLDTWIITNNKIIDVEQAGMFQREVSILHIDKIQDVTSEVNGMIATLVNYGDIYVQTAGQQREFIIHHVPNPDEVRQKLSEVIVRHKERHTEKIAEAISS